MIIRMRSRYGPTISHGCGRPGCRTHHLCVGYLRQQVRQVVSTQPGVRAVQLQAADGGSHAAGGDHGRRVHGQAVVCADKTAPMMG